MTGQSDEYHEEIWAIPCEDIADISNPLTDDPWGSGLTQEIIDACLADVSRHVATPVPAFCTDPWVHGGRIAWLHDNGWDDEICIDVGVPSMSVPPPSWVVIDGNHRLAAALLRGDETIKVAISGSLDAAMEMFPSSITVQSFSVNSGDEDHSQTADNPSLV